MICPGCGKLIGADESRCPFCGAWRPGLYGMTPRLQRLFGRRLDLDSVVVMTCAALFVLALALEPRAIFRAGGGGPLGLIFGFLSPDGSALLRLGASGSAMLLSGWWWTLLTAVYLHGSLLHILFNMMWVRQLGPHVTEVYGPARSFVIFSVAGAAGFLLSDLGAIYLFHQRTLAVGASGSIFGLLAALIVYGRRRHIPTLSAQLMQWAIVMFVMGFTMQHVDNLAHLGGFAGGWVTASLMHFGDEKRESARIQLLALALLGLTGAGFVLSFVTVTRLLSQPGG